jgi:hypothetical protein
MEKAFLSSTFGKNPILTRKDWILVLTLFFVHVFIGLAYMKWLDVSIMGNLGERPWDWWWQLVPSNFLTEDLWRSIWFLHSQPPLYNLYGAFFFNVFKTNPIGAMEVSNHILGGLIPSMVYIILFLLTDRRLLAFLMSIAVVLDPGLLLFESYMLYDLSTVFIIMASTCMITIYWKTRRDSASFFL